MHILSGSSGFEVQAPGCPRTLIGGVGYRWLGDASFGPIAAEAIAREPLPAGTEVADLGYGAIQVVQDLTAAGGPVYARILLIAGVARGRVPGRLYSYHWKGLPISTGELDARIREAGAGVVDLDLLLSVADHFGALPGVTEVIELEPVESTIGETLSAPAAEALRAVVARGTARVDGSLDRPR